MLTRIKICCIRSVNEAAMAVQAGAAALGLVGPMPSGPGTIDNGRIREIARWVPPSVATFLLTSETTAAAILTHYGKTHTTAIQLVDAVDVATYEVLRRELPHVKLVQVIHVTGEASVSQAKAVAPLVDALLLDSGNPALPVKELGGTGRTHDWQLSRRIRDSVDTPVFLAGGLNSENVARAVAAVRPFGLDCCSGLRTNGLLDRHKLTAFTQAARQRASKV